MSCWFLLVFQACALLDVDPARRADPITVRQFGKVDVALTRWILYLDKNDAHSQLMAMVSSRRNDVASIVLALNDYYQLWSNIRSWSAGSAGLVGLTATEVGIKSMEAAVSRMKDTLKSTLVSPRETAALVALFLADAQSRLGRYEESLVSYRTATELGSSVARMFIGHCYHLGRGVPANATLAELWYRSAADSFMRGDATQDAPGQSPAFATRSLARAYMKGLDVYKPIGLPQPRCPGSSTV
jgi:TPR repeat protein